MRSPYPGFMTATQIAVCGYLARAERRGPCCTARRGLRRSKERGFTLPELMLVIAVIGLLTSQAVPPMSRGWDGLMAGRLANSLLTVTESVRQQAITAEQDAVIEFAEQHWCGRFADAEPGTCNLAAGKLPDNYHFEPISESYPSFLYSAGRGFSQFHSGTVRIVKRTNGKNTRALYLINSSLGRLRTCADERLFGIPQC